MQDCDGLVERPAYEAALARAFAVHPVVALLGPRQAGKTTLARAFAAAAPSFDGDANYFDLEDPLHEARLANPRLALAELRGLVVVDEVQRAPDLFRVLRVLVDRPDNAARFLILGSASRELIRQSSETLAGRVEYIELTPLSATEVAPGQLRSLWLRGGFPPALLAVDDDAAFQWLGAFVRNYLERDLPSLGLTLPAASLRRFWLMLTHVHGQLLNMSEIGRSFGVADTTVKRYLDILVGTFMMRLLPPWHQNLGKRQVKRPKVYFRDAGVLHSLLGIAGQSALQAHPKLGASWEGVALEEIIRWRRATEGETYFWSIHAQAELDLFIIQGGRRSGYEIKYSDQPRVTRSMRKAIDALGLDELTVVYPGAGDAPLEDGIRAVGLETLVRS